MTNFHIVYKNLISDFMSVGINYKVDTIEKAISDFKSAAPSAQLIAVYDLDALNDIKGIEKIKITEEV